MWSMTWPILMVVISNVLYHICSKSMPKDINSFAALAVTYCVGAVCSLILAFYTGGSTAEFSKINWTPIALGFAIVGLEFGYICMYRNDWPLNVGSLVSNVALGVVLIAVGYFFYQETLSMQKAVGIAVCCIGLAIINY